MYLENISKYITSGAIFAKNKKAYRKNSSGPVLLTILAGIVPGVVLRGYYLCLTAILVILAFSCALSVYRITSNILTLKKKLILETIIYGTWVSELSILEFMYFTMWKGVNFWVLLIYLPVILVPIFAGIKANKMMKGLNYIPKSIAQNNIRVVGFFAGILGMNFMAIFRNIDQSIAIVIGLLCFSVLNGFMSLGLLSIQKLHYLKKYNLSITTQGDGSPVS